MDAVDEYIKDLTESTNPHNLALFVHSYMQWVENYSFFT